VRGRRLFLSYGDEFFVELILVIVLNDVLELGYSDLIKLLTCPSVFEIFI
jgi:hypothetical protein